jgi:hypothetical protein
MKQIIALLILVLFLIGCQPVAQPVAPRPNAATNPPPAPTPPSAVEVAPGPVPPAPTGPAQSAYEVAAEVSAPTSGSAGPTTAQDTVILKQGDFRDVVHNTHGRAQIARVPGGGLALNLLGFFTDAGPGLTIVLHSGDPATGLAVSGLTSNTGSYSYTLPANTDLRKYTKVSIYNKKYNVIWGEAELR